MRFRDVQVIRLDTDDIQHRVDEGSPRPPPGFVRQLDADLQLGDRERRDGHVVVIVDQGGECREAAPLGVNEDRRIEDQSRQGSVAGPMVIRSSRKSAAHSESGR